MQAWLCCKGEVPGVSLHVLIPPGHRQQLSHSVVAKQHVHHKGKCPLRAKAQHYNISRYTALSTTPIHPLFAVFFPQYENSRILQIIVGCQESEIKSKIGTSASISTLSSQLGEKGKKKKSRFSLWEAMAFRYSYFLGEIFTFGHSWQ